MARDKYTPEMVHMDKRILDYRTEILADAQLFIADLETKPDVTRQVGTLSVSVRLCPSLSVY